MLGRVREALFSSLGERVADARVLDLYAGTGSLGIEALSRGADFVRFVERGRPISQVGQANLASLGAASRAEWWSGDALSDRAWTGGPWDLIFLDPPYPFVQEAQGKCALLQAVRSLLDAHLAPGGLMMLHAEPRVLSANDFEAFADLREKRYGRSILWYLELASEPTESEPEEAPE